MNSLKNLMILAALAAAGYVVYQSLAQNNTDPGPPPPGVAQQWATPPKVDLPGVRTPSTTGGPLPISAPTSVNPAPAFTAAKEPPATNLPFGIAAPTASAAAPGAISSAPSVSTTAAPAAPYASSTAAAPLSAPVPLNPLMPPSSPAATLGPPVSPDAAATLPSSDFSSASGPKPGSETTRNLPAPAATPGSPDNLVQTKFNEFMNEVQKSLDEGKLVEAHTALSTLYGNPDLPPEQAQQITALLDQLAGTVIYSRKHYLLPAYVTQPGDTLEGVAQKHDIPWQLLALINGLMPPGPPDENCGVKNQPLPAGMELKVVRGPFNAFVNLEKHELTLMVQNLYAGRFSIGLGNDQPKLDGEYTVRDKVLNPPYFGPDGITIAPNDPKNPLGGAWIGLSDRVGIHGASDPKAVGRNDNRGTICVGPRDLQDLYGILSVGSRVTIMR